MVGDRLSANIGIGQVLSEEMGGQSLHLRGRSLTEIKGLAIFANSFVDHAKGH